MKTKITNIQLRPVFDQNNQPHPAPLIAALEDLLRRPVPPRTGLKIRNIVRVVNQQATDVDAERMRLIEQHAKRDEAGEMMYEDEEKTIPQLNGDFREEFSELLALDFEVEALTFSELDGIGQVTGQTLYNLGDLLFDDVTPKEETPPENTTKPEAATKRQRKRR